MIDAGHRTRDAATLLPDRPDRPWWPVFEKVLLVIVVVEAALGGNGYLIQLDGIRLRVLLFPLCMIWAWLRATRIKPVRMPVEIIWLFVFFAGVTAFDAALGLYRGNSTAAILAELKPLCYFPMLFFYIATIQDRKAVSLVAGLLVGCGTLLAIVYLLTIAGIRLGIIDEVSVWQLLHVSDEFIFRGFPIVDFFYKGAFYIFIAALFLIFDPFKATKLVAFIVVVASVLTLTRGLILALLVCVLAGLLLCREWKRMLLFAGQAALLLAIIALVSRADPTMSLAPVETAMARLCPPSPEQMGEALPPKRSITADVLKLSEHIPVVRPEDDVRVADIKWVAHELNWSTALIGRGFGTPIRKPDRDRIEVNYVEMLYKQGVFGLAVWVALFLYIFHLYLNVRHGTRRFALAFFLTALFVFVANATNPFLAGSMGMAAVFISMASLLVLSKEKPQPLTEADWYGSGTWRLLRPLQPLNLALINAIGTIVLIGVLLFVTFRLLDNHGTAASGPTTPDQGNPTFPVVLGRTPIQSAALSSESLVQAPSYNVAKLPRLEPNNALYFCTGRDRSALLGGWSESEPAGAWSEGHSAYIGFVVNGGAGSGPPRQAIMHVTVWLVTGKLRTQRVQIWADDHELGEYYLHASPADLKIPLTGVHIKSGAPLILGFYLPDANSPHALVNSSDYRVVAIRAEALELVW